MNPTRRASQVEWPQEHQHLEGMINQEMYAFGDPTNNLSLARTHLNASAAHHGNGDHKAAHGSLLTAIEHYKAHNIKRQEGALDNTFADQLGRSYKQGYELA